MGRQYSRCQRLGLCCAELEDLVPDVILLIFTLLPQAAFSLGCVSRNLMNICSAGQLLPSQRSSSTSAAFNKGAIHVTLHVNPAYYIWQRGLLQHGRPDVLSEATSAAGLDLAIRAAEYLVQYPKAIVHLGVNVSATYSAEGFKNTICVGQETFFADVMELAELSLPMVTLGVHHVVSSEWRMSVNQILVGTSHM